MKERNLSLIICLLSFFISCDQTADKNPIQANEVDKPESIKDEAVVPQTKNPNTDSLDSLKEIQRVKTLKAIAECKIDFLIEIRSSLGHLTYQQVLEFLENFNDVCESNIEYSEFNNYLLFSIFRMQPELILKVISENKTLQFNYITKNLTNPINDTINLKGIYRKVENAKSYGRIKDSVLLSLKTAIDSYN